MAMKPSHPGALIAADLEELGVSVAAAAEAIGITRQQLHRVIRGQCGVSADMAVRLGIALGSTAEFWLRMQAAYDVANVDPATVAGVRPIQAAA